MTRDGSEREAPRASGGPGRIRSAGGSGPRAALVQFTFTMVTLGIAAVVALLLGAIGSTAITGSGVRVVDPFEER